MQVIKTENDSECFKLGANNHFYIIKEINYYFLVTIDFPQVFNQNQLEHESMRSEETGSQAEVEPVYQALFSQIIVHLSSKIVRLNIIRRVIRTVLVEIYKLSNIEVPQLLGRSFEHAKPASSSFKHQ
jgi:hypothetical protein